MYTFFLTILQDIPQPFDIPAPGGGELDVSILWDYQVLYDALRAFRTVFAFAEQNYILQIFLGLGLIMIAARFFLTGKGYDESSGDGGATTEESLAEKEDRAVMVAQAMRRDI